MSRRFWSGRQSKRQFIWQVSRTNMFSHDAIYQVSKQFIIQRLLLRYRQNDIKLLHSEKLPYLMRWKHRLEHDKQACDAKEWRKPGLSTYNTCQDHCNCKWRSSNSFFQANCSSKSGDGRWMWWWHSTGANHLFRIPFLILQPAYLNGPYWKIKQEITWRQRL